MAERSDVEREGLRIRFTVSSDPQLISTRLREQYHISNVEIQDMNLREIYLAVTGFTGGINHDRLENLA